MWMIGGEQGIGVNSQRTTIFNNSYLVKVSTWGMGGVEIVQIHVNVVCTRPQRTTLKLDFPPYLVYFDHYCISVKSQIGVNFKVL